MHRPLCLLPLLVLGLSVLPGGCSGTADVEVGRPEGSSRSRRGPTETWDVIYMGQKKVGYAHTTIRPLSEGGRKLLQIVSESQNTMKRFGDWTTVRVVLTSVETPAGQLVRFRCEQTAGPAVITTVGQCRADRILLQTHSLGKTVQDCMAWDRSWGGFFASEQSLRNQPMKPGERRTVRCLLPVFNQVGDVQMEAIRLEQTPLLAGPRSLLKIQGVVLLGGTKIEQILWADRTGEVLKTVTPAVGQVTYRTTKAVALGQTGAFDLGKMSLVKVARPLLRPHQTRRIVYRARVRQGTLAGVFASGPTQSVRAIGPDAVELTVRAIRPDRPAQLAEPDTPPTEETLAPNNFVQSDDARIVQMAAAVAPEETDPWKIATQLERYVKQTITEKSFSQAFATASEVAQTREGDCTEHAVLLAALCRARKIPARVAIGLVYVLDGAGGGFAYHMWDEVWIRDRWVPLDATLGRGGIGAAHLKLADSSLSGASAYSAFLPVIQLIGRLELQIVDVQ